LLKYKIVVEYEGTNYHGWQNQKDLKTVQGEIEYAIFKFTKKTITVYGASRTDAGVHAYGQVAHFQLEKYYETHEIQNAINYYLKPQKITIIKIEKVGDDFHARFSNKSKQYVYKIINRKSPLTLHKDRAWHVMPPLNIANIITASQYLVGTFDFTSFRSAGCQANSPLKTINSINFEQIDNEISIIFDAKSFLYNQIRIMVGTLKDFGTKEICPSHMSKIINGRNRKLAGETAPSCGLYLNKISYY
jgi:tRNA pseudouridine38-40 synthase